MLSSQPGINDIRRKDQLAMLEAERSREAELATLCQRITELLTHFNNHDIAWELQRLHNEQPEDQRGGYRMEIAMMSKDYQTGAYDSSL